jgi:hypothetical protein
MIKIWTLVHANLPQNQSDLILSIALLFIQKPLITILYLKLSIFIIYKYILSKSYLIKVNYLILILFLPGLNRILILIHNAFVIKTILS